jgi:hypothetical protein
MKLTPLIAIIVLVLTTFSCSKEPIKKLNQWQLSDEHFNELLELCDTNTLHTYEDFQTRLNRILEIFVDYQDPRGAFPSVYKAITDAGLTSLTEDAAIYENSQFAYDFGLHFSKSYLKFLKLHLLNELLEHHWELYYRYCKEQKHITRLVVEGINAHVSIDLPRSLAAVDVVRENKNDWILFGERVVEVVPEFLEKLEQDYGADASGIFNVYILGDMVDQFLGEGSMISIGFNLLRLDAFENAIRMQDPDKTIFIERKMEKSFYEREGMIDMLDRMGLME